MPHRVPVRRCRPSDFPPYPPGSRLGVKWRRPRAQALVEFALILPMLLLLIGFVIDGARLGISKADQDRRTQVVADWAASRPGDDSWQSVAHQVLPDCTVEVDRVGRPGLVSAGARCSFISLMLHAWVDLLVSSEAVAVVDDTPAPTPSDTPEPSASVGP